MTPAGRRAGGPAGGAADRTPPSEPARPSALPTEGRLLAVDWGTKRIGLAVTDPTRTIAQPLATIVRRAGRRFPMRKLRAYLEEYAPTGIVVGLPLTSEGTEGPAAQAARAVAELIAEKTGLPVVLVDERMTTARAAEADAVGGRVDRDQRAASILLQGYLERERR